MRASSNPKAAAPSSSTRQAAAPAASAAGTKRRPSVAAPGQATKPSPGCTARLSLRSVAVTRAPSHCAASWGEFSRVMATSEALQFGRRRPGIDLRRHVQVGRHVHHAQRLLHDLAEHRRCHRAAVVHALARLVHHHRHHDARIADQGYSACALEASSIGLDEQRLNATRIEVALFTNFTRDHLDYHAGMDAYWAAKRRLFAWPGLRAAVINIDDEYGAQLADDLRGAGLDLWTVSRLGPARLAAHGLFYSSSGLSFDVTEEAATAAVQSTLVGDYNASNLLVVLGALRALGVPLSLIHISEPTRPY